MSTEQNEPTEVTPAEPDGAALKEGRTRVKPLVVGIVVTLVAVATIIIAAVFYHNDQSLIGSDEPAKESNATDKTNLPATKTPLAQNPDTAKADKLEDGEAEEAPDSPTTTTNPGDQNTGNTGGASNTGSSSNPGSTAPGTGVPSNTGTSTPSRTWHEGWNEWVVDVAGHNERQLVSAAKDVPTGHWGDRCNDCGAEVTGNYVNHAKATGHNSGYSSPFWFDTGTIHHDAVYQDVWIPEKGHNVWHEGYWE